MTDCSKCGTEHPAEDLAEDGLCVICSDAAVVAGPPVRPKVAPALTKQQIKAIATKRKAKSNLKYRIDRRDTLNNYDREYRKRNA